MDDHRDISAFRHRFNLADRASANQAPHAMAYGTEVAENLVGGVLALKDAIREDAVISVSRLGYPAFPVWQFVRDHPGSDKVRVRDGVREVIAAVGNGEAALSFFLDGPQEDGVPVRVARLVAGDLDRLRADLPDDAADMRL